MAVDLDSVPAAGPDTVPTAGPDTGPAAGPDTGPDPGSDAVSDVAADDGPDAGITQSSKTVGPNGGDLILDGATLTIGRGTFQNPTQVILREYPKIDYAGAYGPVFEISVPAAGLFRQVATLTLPAPSPSIGANQANLVLGALDPSRLPADQQWVAVSDSSLSLEQTSVTGSVSDFGNASVFEYAVVLGCTLTAQCRTGEACNASACQQCPTSSQCAQ